MLLNVQKHFKNIEQEPLYFLFKVPKGFTIFLELPFKCLCNCKMQSFIEEAVLLSYSPGTFL